MYAYTHILTHIHEEHVGADGYAARTLQYVWGIDGSEVSFDEDAMMRNGVIELAQFDLVTWPYYNGSHRYDNHGTVPYGMVPYSIVQ